jgi:glycosyltransferase involved in cell wall biosynthesis
MKTVVTIGICVRNSETSVKETINSIQNQDFPHELMEVIVVDDGSEDRTLKIVLDLVSKMDMQVKVFRGEWKGMGTVRNIVVDNAQGEYIIWVDGDMILPKNHLRRQVKFIEQNPKVGIAKAKHRVTPEENLVAFLEHVPFMVYDANPEILSSKLPGTGGAIYRVSAIRQVNGFDNRLRYAGEDQDAAYRVKKARWLIVQSPAVFYEIRDQTWKQLWDKYVWYGYGNHDLYNKNREIFSLYRMNPIAGFVAGILYAFDAYRLIKRKSLILLPFHFTLKMTAWSVGFTKARIESIIRKPRYIEEH